MVAMRVAALLCLLAALPALAQESTRPEPKIERIVLQDDNTRIEELRVRGQTQKVTVKPKNAPEYEVITAPGGRDPSVGRAGNKDSTGQRVWNVFKF
jgi:Protein of unknown function (DUF2782)